MDRELIMGTLGARWEYSLNGTPLHHRAHTHSQGKFSVASPPAIPAYVWEVEGKQLNPCEHEENMHRISERDTNPCSGLNQGPQGCEPYCCPLRQHVNAAGK